jgi:hypothetical protein
MAEFLSRFKGKGKQNQTNDSVAADENEPRPDGATEQDVTEAAPLFPNGQIPPKKKFAFL